MMLRISVSSQIMAKYSHFCFFVFFFQSNAQRSQSKHWGDKICRGKMGDIGYAPILLSIIIFLMFLFINSVIAGKILIFYSLTFDGG